MGLGLSVTMIAAGCGNVETAFDDPPVGSQQAEVTIGLDGVAFEGHWERRAQGKLRKLAVRPAEFHATLGAVYGDAYDHAMAEQLREHIIADDFGWMPVAQLVHGDVLPGAVAAYSEIENRIYLNAELRNTPLRAYAYLEEVGHALDSLLVAQDTVGDEGEAFMRHVLQLPAADSSSPDHGFITVDGREIGVEFGWLDDVWDAVKDAADWTGDTIGDAAEWTWEQLESATEWVLGGIEETWDYLKRNVNWACVANGLLAIGACGTCVGAFVAAPETAGTSLVAAKEICGVVCVGAAIAMANECAGGGATTENSTVPVASVQGQLTTSLSTHPRSFAQLFDGKNRSGDWQKFPIGTWNVNSFNYLGNDKTSSLQLTPGLVTKLCSENTDTFGDCVEFRVGQDESKWFNGYGNVLNNRVSWLKVIPGVTVYDGTSYGGAKWTYGPGSHKASTFVNVGNDKVSSLKVAPGVSARLCAESGNGNPGSGWGDCVTIQGDTVVPALGSIINNRVSNIEVIPGVTVYTGAQYAGMRQTFTPGTYNHTKLSVGNDTITSLVVAPGYQAMLCSETSGPGSGWCHKFTGNVTYVGHEFDNGASYIKVSPILMSPVSDPILSPIFMP